MKLEEWLKSNTALLADASIETARLDCIVLLEDVLGIDRIMILAEPDRLISDKEQAQLTKLLNRRAMHEPLAYIRGKAEFFGRNFVITPAVLTPRPESEAIIELLGELSALGEFGPDGVKKGTQRPKTLKIADVGAGSGALGITAKLEFPDAMDVQVDLLEIDEKALKIAKINADKYTTAIKVIESDLLNSSSMDYDVLLCNLPYVPDDYDVNKATTFEPKIALFAGPDGLDLYRKLAKQVSKLDFRPLYILTESLPSQHAEMTKLFADAGYDLRKTRDFIQLFALNKIS